MKAILKKTLLFAGVVILVVAGTLACYFAFVGPDESGPELDFMRSREAPAAASDSGLIPCAEVKTLTAAFSGFSQIHSGPETDSSPHPGTACCVGRQMPASASGT
ncbi:MAG: hypothetical protein AB1921_01905 [Thermodesulfobacteriota bacterium]